MKNLLIAFILLGQLIMLLIADFNNDFWISFYWVWHKGTLLLCMRVISLNIKPIKYANVFNLLAWFFGFMLIWEVIVIFYPPALKNETWARIIFTVLVIEISCIIYLPYVKKIWQKLK